MRFDGWGRKWDEWLLLGHGRVCRPVGEYEWQYDDDGEGGGEGGGDGDDDGGEGDEEDGGRRPAPVRVGTEEGLLEGEGEGEVCVPVGPRRSCVGPHPWDPAAPAPWAAFAALSMIAWR